MNALLLYKLDSHSDAEAEFKSSLSQMNNYELDSLDIVNFNFQCCTYYLGLISLINSEHDKATDYFQKSIEINPDGSITYYQFLSYIESANVQIQSSKHEESKKIIDKISSITLPKDLAKKQFIHNLYLKPNLLKKVRLHINF